VEACWARSQRRIPTTRTSTSGGHASRQAWVPHRRAVTSGGRSALRDKLARREAELAQVRNDLDMVKNDGIGANDPGVELKQRLIDLTKKNRRLQVTVESQKSRLTQLETEVKKPKEEARRQAEEAAMAGNANAMLGEGLEDFKKKFLAASNTLQQVRHEAQELRAQVQRQRKVLLKELGTEDATEKALSVADDPAAVSWKGRAAQIAQLQRQLRELKDQVKSGTAKGGDDLDLEDEPQTTQRPGKVQRVDAVVDKQRAELAQVAEKRREDFERLQEEAEKLRGEQAESKRKREALKSRNGLLETQLRELKVHIQTLLRKSDDDDSLVTVLRRQLGRHGEGEGDEDEEASDVLRQENEELRSQLERQAQIVLKLRQKSMASTVENGSNKLGPKSVESSTSDRQLIERVRYLEAENARCTEQVRLFRERHGEGVDGTGRPFSSESQLRRKEKVLQMEDRAAAEREHLVYRKRSEDHRMDSSPSCRSSSRGSSGGGAALGGIAGGGFVGMAGC